MNEMVECVQRFSEAMTQAMAGWRAEVKRQQEALIQNAAKIEQLKLRDAELLRRIAVLESRNAEGPGRS